MRRNLGTVLAVFVCIFVLAWGLNGARARSLESVTASDSRGADKPRVGLGAAEPAAAGQYKAERSGEVSRGTSDAIPLPGVPGSNAPAADAANALEQQQIVPPAVETIPRNPPNGMLFAGRGKFQLYRQGDITWRLDTDTGQACILFATEEQWDQERVLEHGCATK
jgi:hypothetical protein